MESLYGSAASVLTESVLSELHILLKRMNTTAILQKSGEQNQSSFHLGEEYQVPQERLVPPQYPTESDLNNWFTYHEPKEGQVTKYNAVREAGKFLAKVILHNCPMGPDRTAAVRIVREAVWTANASIACHVEKEDGSR